MFGYHRSDAIGRLATELAAPEYRQLLLQKIAKKETEPFEGVALRKDGTTFPAEMFGRPILYHGSKVRVSAIRDITERKHAEDALKNSLSQLQATLESTDDAILVVDIKGRITNYNKRFLELWHIPKKIMATKDDNLALQYVLKQLREPEKFLEKVRQLYSRSDDVSFDILEFKDGRIFERFSQPQKLDGKNIGRIWSFRDITVRRKAEMALEESVAQFRDLAEKTPNMIFINQRGKIVYANEKCTEIMGYTREEFVAPDFDYRCLIAPESLPISLEIFEEHKRGREVAPYEQVVITKQGQRLHTIHTTRLITFNGKVATLGIITDITERKQAELLQNAVYRISQATDNAASLDDLFGSVHDIISTVMPAKNFYISLYDNATNLISFPYFVDEADTAPAPRKLKKGLTEYVLQTRRALLCDEATNTKLRQDGKVDLVGMLAAVWVGVPLIVDGSAIGVMVAQHYTDSKAYGEKELHMLEYVSSQVAKAIDRKRADEALRNSEARLKSLFAGMTDVILVLDADGRYLEIAPTNPDLLYRPADELIGKTIHEVFPGSQADFFLEAIHRSLTTQKQVTIDYSLNIGDKDIWFQAAVLPLSSTTVLLIARDVTETKMAEEALTSQTAYFEVLFQDSPSGIAILDDDDRMVSVNKSFEKMFQYTNEEVRGLRINDCIVPSNLVNEAQNLSQISQQGNVVSMETVRQRKDGSTLNVYIIGYPIHIEGKRVGIYGMYEDISERKQLEAKMIQAQKMESIGTLASGIAHDFNNILAIVLVSAALIERNADNAAKRSQHLKSIKTAVERGASLVKQILTFARKAEIVFGPVDVNMMIMENARMVLETFPKTIEILFQLDDEIPLINADTTQLQQALLNISVNARDAMPLGGTLSFKTALAGGMDLRDVFADAQDVDYVHIVISDTGIGMDDLTRAHIFDPFFTTKEKGKGTGLGLSVVYGVIKNHNGLIDVQSDPGKGTTFNLYFPISKEIARTSVQKAVEETEIRGGNETILIVEDEAALNEMLKSILEARGYHVLSAFNGLDALALFQEHNEEIALVMTDLGLPKISGEQLIPRLKEVNPSVRIVVMSGFIDPETRAEILRSGLNEFIEKPYNPTEVLKKVRESIDGNRHL